MSELLKPTYKKALVLGSGLALSALALSGCGENKTTDPMVVGVECPAETTVDIERVDNPTKNYDNSADIFLSCDSEQPTSMQLINDGKTQVADAAKGLVRVEITANYYAGGGLEGAGETPRLSTDINPEGNTGQIIVNDINEVTKVEVVE